MIKATLRDKVKDRVNNDPGSRRLTSEQIAALLTRFAEGASRESIAMEFGVSYSTVRNHIRKACKEG